MRRGGSSEMPQDSIQALDVALKHPAMMSPLLVPVARAFYNPRTARSLYGGAEVTMLKNDRSVEASKYDLILLAFLRHPALLLQH